MAPLLVAKWLHGRLQRPFVVLRDSERTHVATRPQFRSRAALIGHCPRCIREYPVAQNELTTSDTAAPLSSGRGRHRQHQLSRQVELSQQPSRQGCGRSGRPGSLRHGISAIARPIPLEEPVTSAVFPLSSSCMARFKWHELHFAVTTVGAGRTASERSDNHSAKLNPYCIQLRVISW